MWTSAFLAAFTNGMEVIGLNSPVIAQIKWRFQIRVLTIQAFVRILSIFDAIYSIAIRQCFDSTPRVSLDKSQSWGGHVYVLLIRLPINVVRVYSQRDSNEI